MKSVQGTEQAEQNASRKEIIICFPVCSIRLDQDTGTFPAKSFLSLDSLILAAPNLFRLDTAI